ncbi:MAG: hypothetical protein KDD96_18405, partial [Rhodobacteraceae bacterium]|nr:hypothetical protein [Paracoccaceae bacterium]
MDSVRNGFMGAPPAGLCQNFGVAGRDFKGLRAGLAKPELGLLDLVADRLFARGQVRAVEH